MTDNIHLNLTKKYDSLLLWQSQVEYFETVLSSFSLNRPILDKCLVVNYIILKNLAFQTCLCCLEVRQKFGWGVILSSSE